MTTCETNSLTTVEPSLRRDWAAPGSFALLLGVMICIPFWDVLLGFRTFAVRDFALFSYPSAFFQRDCFWHGQWPFWNPYSCCGVPFLAQLNTLAVYPLALIYLILPLTWALPAFCLFHLFLGGMGGYFLASEWTKSRSAGVIAGVIFAFNGLALNFLMWPSHVATFGWMPWVILLTQRAWTRGGRSLAPAAAAAAMEVLAGGPETILLTWLILFGLAVIDVAQRRGKAASVAGRFLAVGGLALALSAPQLLPFAELVRHGNRTTGFGNSDWSMPLTGWGNFLVPLFQTWHWQQLNVQEGQYWTSSYYVGIGAIFLAAIAIARRRNARCIFLGVLLLASLVLALGDRGLIFPWLKRAVPVLGMFRYPVKFVILSVIVLPLLAAEGIASYESDANRSRRRLDFWVAGALFVALGALVWIAKHWPAPESSWQVTASNALSRSVFLAAVLAVVWLFVTRPEWRGWTVVLLAAVFWADLLTHEPWQNPTAAPYVYQPNLARETAGIAKLPVLGVSRLLLPPDSANPLRFRPSVDVTTNCLLDRITFFDNCNLLDRVPKVDGFFSLGLRESDRVLGLLESSKGRQWDRLQDLLSVSETVAPGKVFDWVARTNFIPVATIGEAPRFADDAATWRAIVDTNADFRREVYLPLAAKSSVTAQGEPGARILSSTCDMARQTFSVHAPAPAMLVVGQSYYPNWTAQVDGKPARLWRANYAFQAVEVPAGDHEVILSYRDTAFRWGWVAAGLAGLGCAFIWLFARKPEQTGEVAL